MPNIPKFIFDPPPQLQWMLVAASIICLFFVLSFIVAFICLRSTKEQIAELKKRFLSSAILTLIILPCAWCGGIIFALFVAIITWFSVREYLVLVNVWQLKPFRIVSEFAISTLVLAALYESNSLWQIDQLHLFFTLPLFWIVIVLAIPIFLQDYKGMSVRESQTVFSIVYFSWFLLHFILLRNGSNGFAISMFLCFAVVFNDMFAYFAGKLMGHVYLAPIISPKKTWEGAIGGTIGTLISVFLFCWLLPSANNFDLLIYAVVISILSPLGDLIISVIKRDVGKKDSGTLIPGHGGMLDRVGSYILIAPLFYFILKITR